MSADTVTTSNWSSPGVVGDESDPHEITSAERALRRVADVRRMFGTMIEVLLSTIDPGDDILLLSPDWPTYRVMSRITGAKPVHVPTSAGYDIDEEILKSAATKSVSAIVINSPNNPTGGVLSKKQLKLIFDRIQYRS